MGLTLFSAKLQTAGKTAEQIRASYDGPKPNDKEIEYWIKAFNELDGIEIVVLKSFTGEDWCLAAWDEKDEEKIMEFVYLAEQDPYFGSYVDERDEFLKDWKSGEYEPPGSLVFANADVQVIEELTKEK